MSVIIGFPIDICLGDADIVIGGTLTTGAVTGVMGACDSTAVTDGGGRGAGNATGGGGATAIETVAGAAVANAACCFFCLLASFLFAADAQVAL